LLRDCSVTDRILLGLNSPTLDNESVMYILTLGVVERMRHQGIGSSLLAQVLDRARRLHCLAVSLHVIDYNTAAITFYKRNGFKELALLHDFYYIG
jgi:ribosomal protein S18 acetylase RimI-like enzyme